MTILPSNHPKLGTKINYSSSKNKIIISYVNRGKNGKVLNPQNQPKKLSVPKNIDINEKLGEVLGMYYGDGTKNYHPAVEFVNFCPELIELWIRYLNNLGIKSENLYYKIKISENCKIKHNINIQSVKNYWISKLGLTTNHNINTHWVKSKGTPSTYLRKYGSIVVGYNNSTFSLFFNSFIKNIENFLEDEKFRIGFIRGLFAAEGNINVRKNGSLSLIRIAGSKKARIFTSNILKKYFNVIAKDDDQSNQIYFGRLEHEKIKHLNIISLHPEKKEAYDRGYKILMRNLERTPDQNCVLRNKTAIKILNLLKNKELKYKDIIKNIGITRDYLKMLTNGYKHGSKYQYSGLQELGIVEKRKIGSEFILSLTKKGKNLLKQYKL